MAEQARLSLNVRLHVTHARRFDVSLQQQTVTVHTCRIIIFKWLKLVAVWQKTNTNYTKVSLMFRSVKGSGWTWRWPFFHCFLCRLPSRDHDVSSSPPADDINKFVILAPLCCWPTFCAPRLGFGSECWTLRYCCCYWLAVALQLRWPVW